jgi:hypothetical protein
MTHTITGPSGPSSSTAHVPSNVIVPPAPTIVSDAVTVSGIGVAGKVVLVVVLVVDVVVDVVVLLVDVVSSVTTVVVVASVEDGAAAGSGVSLVAVGPTPVSMNRPHVAVIAVSTTVPTPPNLLIMRGS